MKFGFSRTCLAVSWGVLIAGVVVGVNGHPDCFGRSGSLVVLFAVMSEYSLLKAQLDDLYKRLKRQGATQDGGQGMPSLAPPEYHKRLALASHVTIVLGTLIWGFGDLWFKEFSCCH